VEEYNKYWDILNDLKVVAIVAGSPRPGVDFIQSLFDAHSQVLTFDGWLLFHEFYNRAYSLFGTARLIAGDNGENNGLYVDSINSRDFFYEFAWSHLYKFDSRYDNLEGKDSLGIGKNEFNIVDIDSFVDHAVRLIENKKLTSRNAFLATFGAYALARGENMYVKKIILQQVHFPENAVALAQDFSGLKIVACVRDPRIWGTLVVKWNSKMGLSKLSILSAHSFFSRIVNGFKVLDEFKDVDIRINVLEKLHNNPDDTLNKMCLWLGISFENKLLESTWNGKMWNGDSLSTGIEKPFDPMRYVASQDKWKKDLTVIDRIVMEALMRSEIEKNSHVKEFSSRLWDIMLPFLILIPTKYETKIFISILKKQHYKLYFTLAKVMLARYLYSYRKLFNNIFRKPHYISRF
jgi:hypothetical protein